LHLNEQENGKQSENNKKIHVQCTYVGKYTTVFKIIEFFRLKNAKNYPKLYTAYR